MRAEVLKHLREAGRVGEDVDLVPEHQVFLLGGNPLPIRIAAGVLQPKVAHLVWTDNVNPSLDPLEIQIKKLQGSDSIIKNWYLSDAASEYAIHGILKEIKKNIGNVPMGLHYTGGTKEMSAQSRLWWHENYGKQQAHQCSYLDGQRDLMLFNQVSKGFDVHRLDISIQEILALHRAEIPDPTTPEDREFVEEIAKICIVEKKWSKWTSVLPNLYPAKLDLPATIFGGTASDKDVRISHVNANDDKNFKSSALFGKWTFDKALSEFPGRFPGVAPGTMLSKTLKRYTSQSSASAWLIAEWLEDWLYYKYSPIIPNINLYKDLNLNTWENARISFQVDLVGCVHHRPLFMSITAGNHHEARYKSMEVLTRAHQIGGDHAAFVMAFCPDDGKEDEQMSRMLNLLGDHWGSPDTFRVLGTPHYRGESAITHLARNGTPIRETAEEMFNNWLKP